jgi:hypothetical protein
LRLLEQLRKPSGYFQSSLMLLPHAGDALSPAPVAHRPLPPVRSVPELRSHPSLNPAVGCRYQFPLSLRGHCLPPPPKYFTAARGSRSSVAITVRWDRTAPRTAYVAPGVEVELPTALVKSNAGFSQGLKRRTAARVALVVVVEPSACLIVPPSASTDISGHHRSTPGQGKEKPSPPEPFVGPPLSEQLCRRPEIHSPGCLLTAGAPKVNEQRRRHPGRVLPSSY